MLWIAGLSGLVGCAGTDGSANEEPEASVPLPWIFEEETLAEPSLDAATAAAALQEGVAMAMARTAPAVFPSYEAAMDGQSAGCPDYYDYDGNVYWYDNCTGSNGSAFSGYSFYTRYDQLDGGDGLIYDGESLSGVARIGTPEGHVFEAGGSAYYYQAHHDAANDQDATYDYFVSIVQGSFSYDGPEAAGTWLAEEAAPDISFQGAYLPDMDARTAILDGSISGLSGAVEYMVFDALTVFSPAISTCPEEPGGGFSVRGADGYWYDVIFDGPMEWGETVERGACDGCGRLYFQGEELGEVCVGETEMLAWGVSPW